MCFAFLCASSLMAQSPSATPQPLAGAAGGVSSQAASANVTWDGKTWRVSDQRLFEAGFERYLKEPGGVSEEDKEYRKLISGISDLVASEKVSPENLEAALRLLTRASHFAIDARLCASLADAVDVVVKARQNAERIAADRKALEEKRERAAADRKALEEKRAHPQLRPGILLLDTEAPIVSGSAADLDRRMLANVAAEELSLIQSKVEFQALILQFFLQRRFEHALLATRFYRALFPGGDARLNVGRDFEALFEKEGMPLTLGSLESLANEALRRVRDGVQAYETLLRKNEMEAATQQLSDAFTIGEYTPEIRALPLEMKLKALRFKHDPLAQPKP